MQKDISRAVKILSNGGLVAFPTETVYGLGADARNENAIRKVFAAKGRPIDHPLIVHIQKISQLEDWAINIPSNAKLLAERFWPGPLTLVLQKNSAVSNLVTGNQDTIALRIPNHPLTLTMLAQFGSGIVGPSANTYGRISPTTAEHVLTDLGNKVDYILDGDCCDIGIESTIVHFIGNKLQILRQGNITETDILQVLGNNATNLVHPTTKIRVPGQVESHYAPSKPLFLVPATDILSLAKLVNTNQLKYSFLSFQACPIGCTNISWHQATNQALVYARNLYALLHQLDAEDTAGIIVELPPNKEYWLAINDRLTRASGGNTLTLAALQKC